MDAQVIAQASEYLNLMSEITRPEDMCFRSFLTDGVGGLAELCEAAALRAHGGADALASLVIAPGDVSSFRIDGRHARATLQACPTPNTRLVVLLVLLAIVAFIFIARRRG